MVIENNPSTVLTVKDMKCKAVRLETFLKKQPQNKPINLLIRFNERPDTIEKMAQRAEVKTEAEIYHPIEINSWSGFPLTKN
jgi:hypothetical protein